MQLHMERGTRRECGALTDNDDQVKDGGNWLVLIGLVFALETVTCLQAVKFALLAFALTVTADLSALCRKAILEVDTVLGSGKIESEGPPWKLSHAGQTHTDGLPRQASAAKHLKHTHTYARSFIHPLMRKIGTAKT